MTIVLLRTRKLLDRTSETEVDVTFEALENDIGGLVVISRVEWEEMGEPDQITVSIMGGDGLNSDRDPDLERSKRERGK